MRKRVFIPIRKCRVCKESFQPKQKTSIMCSESCRWKHKRDWHIDRYAELKKIRFAKAEKKECKKCKKEFPAIPITRVFCSRSCSNKFKKPYQKVENPARFYKKHSFRDYSLGVDLDTQEKKEAHRKELQIATEKFLKEGGRIIKLLTVPEPKLPTVGSKYWNWETLVGLDPFGTEDFSEPDYVVDDIISIFNE